MHTETSTLKSKQQLLYEYIYIYIFPIYQGFSFDVEALLASITPKTRLIIINSPANPTGGVVPKATMDRLAEGLMKHPHVTLMSDEIYCRLQYTGLDCSPSMLT
jgi:aspartate/methionine/tyrosine aminotransferase